MKIEIAESLIRSWLRHVKHCEFAELNWKPSQAWQIGDNQLVQQVFNAAFEVWPEAFGSNTANQLLKQAEVDVFGLSCSNDELFLVDVAFHSAGLNYGSRDATAKRVYKKLVRSALLALRYFHGKRATIYFISPFTTPATVGDLAQVLEKLDAIPQFDEHISFKMITEREHFQQHVITPLISLDNTVADTSELFLRSWQLISPFLKLSKTSNVTAHCREQIAESSVARDKVLICALYLAKFGHLNCLGFGNQSQTMQQLAERLSVNVNSLKGYRDRFDRYVDSPRVGYDLPLSDELAQYINHYNGLDENQLRLLLPS